MAPRRVSTRFEFGLISVTVVAGLLLTASPRADQQIAVRSIQVPSIQVPSIAVPRVPVPKVDGQSVKPTILMVTDRALSSVQSDAAALEDVRRWDQTVTELQRASRLRRRSLEADRAVRGRTFERFDQMHEGVRVFGADVTRQTNEFGQAVSVFGTIYDTITVDTAPDFTAARAALILASAGNGVVGPASEQELVVLPLDGGARLTWTARVFSKVDGHVERIFVDAQSGAVVYSYNDTWTQGVSTTASGTGVAGDGLTMPVSISRSLLTGSFAGRRSSSALASTRHST